MATDLEIRERQRNHLRTLLRLKKANDVVIGLEEEILIAVAGMMEEDVALIEKLIGIKAL